MFTHHGWTKTEKKGSTDSDILKSSLDPTFQTKMKGKNYFLCKGKLLGSGSFSIPTRKIAGKEPFPTSKNYIELLMRDRGLEYGEDFKLLLLNEYNSNYQKTVTQSSIRDYKSEFNGINFFPKNPDEEKQALNVINDWSSCIDDCYRVREKCLNFEPPSYKCDYGHDDCVDWCDENFITLDLK